MLTNPDAQEQGSRRIPQRVYLCAISLAVLVGWIVFVNLRADELQEMGHFSLPFYVGVSFTFGVVVAGVVAGVVFFTSRRSARAVRWTYGIILAFFLWSQVENVESFRQTGTHHSRVLAGVKRDLEPVLRGLTANHYVGDAATVGKAADALERASAQSRGEAASVFAVFGRFARESQARVAAQERLVDKFLAIDWSHATEQAQLIRAQSALAAVEQATLAIWTAQEGAVRRLNALLREGGVPEHARRQYLRSLTASEPLRVELWHLNLQLLKTYRDRLQLLRQHWGQWKFDSKADRYLFRDKTAGAAFDAAQSRFLAAGAEFQAAEQRLLAHLKGSAQRLLDR